MTKGQLVQRETRFLAPIEGMEVRDSGVGDGSYTVRGHAAVFDKLSLDLGGFQEKIAKGAFTNALSGNPDVLQVWDHDTRYTLSRTLNNTLELREDPYGLHFWGRVAPTSYAADLRILLERGDISQCSFMFTIERETWEYVEQEGQRDEITATIEEVGTLYDVTICGRGAYPQTDVGIASRSARFQSALREGRVPGLTLDKARESGLFSEDPRRGEITAGREAAAPEGADGNRGRALVLARSRAALAVARGLTPKE